MNEEIKKILMKALDIERWAPKTNATYPFLEDEEKEEMVNNIIKELKANEYDISKVVGWERYKINKKE